MGDFLGLAMQHNRTLVALPGSYGPALNSDCKDLNQTGEWTCFFFPLAHPACSSLISHLQANAAAAVVSRWGYPHKQRPVMVDRQGALYTMSDEKAQLHWWRSQATRFFLRWPSLHLCHVINRERHISTGLHVAASLAPTIAAQASLLHSLSSGSVPGTTAATNTTFAVRINAMGRLCGATMMANTTVDELIASTGRGELLTLDAVTIALGGEPYLPRPMAAVHVSRGDEARTEGAGETAGGAAGKTVGKSGDQLMAAVSQALQRLQWLSPDLRRVWLSGDARGTAPIQQHLEERDWALLHSTLTRNPPTLLPAADAAADAAGAGGGERDGLESLASAAAGAEALPEAAVVFADLLTSSLTDFLIADISTESGDFIHELRCTNGRLFSPVCDLSLT
ncbi:unnamed protein product [Closterium sp. Yama58-4]|nr:unnamed protein product [Closterium sp. Yama58-4]